MQFRTVSAFLVFIGSYLPLAIILAVQDIPSTWWSLPICNFIDLDIANCSFIPFKNPNPSLIFVCICTLSVVVSNFLFRKISFPFVVDVQEFKAIPNDIINYTFPYVVSFMGISYDETEKLFGFGVFLLWMFAITYKSGQIIMNPLLLMFGWKLYEATILINGVTRHIQILKQGSITQGQLDVQTIQDFYIARD
jgi:hypothetical protein